MTLLRADTTATKVTLKSLINAPQSLNGVITLKANETKEVDLAGMNPAIRRRAWAAIQNANGKSIEMTLSTGVMLPRHVAKNPTTAAPRFQRSTDLSRPAVVAGPAIKPKVDGPALTIDTKVTPGLDPVTGKNVKHTPPAPAGTSPAQLQAAAAAAATPAAPAPAAAPAAPAAPVVAPAVVPPAAPPAAVETAPAVAAPTAPVVEVTPAVVTPAATVTPVETVVTPAATVAPVAETVPAAPAAPTV